MKNLFKKIISIVSLVCFSMLIIPSKHSNANIIDDLPKILQYASEFEILQNDSYYGIAYAILNNEKTTIQWDKVTNSVNMYTENINSRSNSKTETNFNIEIDENFNISGDILVDEEFYSIDYLEELSENYNDNSRFVLSLGSVLGAAVLKALIATTATVVIAGVTYALITEVATTLKNNKNYTHYKAAIRYSSKLKRYDLFVGDDISFTKAVSRLKNGNDVWSKASASAGNVARTAGNGNEPIRDNPHGGAGYYPHYHIYDRSGGHSFYSY